MRRRLFMGKISLLLFLLYSGSNLAQVQLHTDSNRTLTYHGIIRNYQLLKAAAPSRCEMSIAGASDIGRPVHAFVIHPSSKKKDPVTIMINNGIHPGEPDGIDASLLFAEELTRNPGLFPDIRFVIIPVYNVDGASIQQCCTRANQNGPENQGFRGNGRNLDLNRDFIKCDARNTLAFISIFQKWKPHFLVDNHVSNGADYQYTMTLICSQHNKLGPVLGPFMNEVVAPALFRDMEKKGMAMAPYVNTPYTTPDSGITGFLETPRFSTGYAALFHCLGLVPETHMLKPFAQRVQQTYELMKTISTFAQQHQEQVRQIRDKAITNSLHAEQFPLAWVADTAKYDTLYFHGYEAGYKPSQVSGRPRLYYDRNKPFVKPVKFFNYYRDTLYADKPRAYIIPQAWHQVIGLLKANGVTMEVITADTTLTVIADYITNYKSTSRPYEGHYLHYGIETRSVEAAIPVFAGDVLIPAAQPAARFLAETLEPKGPDSYFAWNFFDSVLQQKEGYSDYVFEDLAVKILEEDPSLRARLEERKKNEPEFRNNGNAQLDFVYKSSTYYETSHNRYPVYKLFSQPPPYLTRKR